MEEGERVEEVELSEPGERRREVEKDGFGVT